MINSDHEAGHATNTVFQTLDVNWPEMDQSLQAVLTRA